jgi:hypothetical protein
MFNYICIMVITYFTSQYNYNMEETPAGERVCPDRLAYHGVYLNLIHAGMNLSFFAIVAFFVRLMIKGTHCIQDLQEIERLEAKLKEEQDVSLSITRAGNVSNRLSKRCIILRNVLYVVLWASIVIYQFLMAVFENVGRDTHGNARGLLTANICIALFSSVMYVLTYLRLSGAMKEITDIDLS